MAANQSKPDLESEIARLYALPLAEFTPERNALAVRLRKEGDREASERVKALAKPPASAWAVNVLFRDQKKKMDALLAAGERARGALQKALTHGTADTLRDALHEERALRDDLRRHAVALLTEDGREPGRAIVDRITVDLEALALSPAAAEAAERGWLDSDLDPPGFEVLAGLQLAARPERHGLRLVPAPEKPAEKPAATPKKAAHEKGKEKEKEEKAERERQEREEAKRQERIGRAEEKVARAAEEAATLRGEAERTERAAVEAERAAEEARRRAEADREAADRARARADRAAELLTRAEGELAKWSSGS